MKKDILRNASLPAFLAGGFILLDLALDRYLGGPASSTGHTSSSQYQYCWFRTFW